MTRPTRLLAPLWTLLLLAAAASAGGHKTPEQAIVGAEEPIPLGELVALGLSPIKERPEHLHSQDSSWKVFDGHEEKRAIEHGEGVFFGAGIKKKTLLVVCSTAYVFVEKGVNGGADETAVLMAVRTARVVIGEPGPGPDPGPEPGPGPKPPDLPDGEFGLAKYAHETAMKTVPAGHRVKGAKALAGGFSSVKAAIAAGTVKTPDEALKKTTELNVSKLRAAVGEEGYQAWQPFSIALRDHLFSLYQSGKLSSTPQFATAWGELSQGLEAVTE